MNYTLSISLAVVAALGQGYTAHRCANFKAVAVGVGNSDVYAMSGLYGTYFDKLSKGEAKHPEIQYEPDEETKKWLAEREAQANDTEPPPPAPTPAPTPAKVKIPEPISETELNELTQLTVWGNRTKTPQKEAYANASPPMQRALLALAKDCQTLGLPKPVVNSVWRSRADQSFLKRTLKDRPVGSPDRSPHRSGNAADMSRATVEVLEAHGLLAKHGLFVPSFVGEAWHVELAHNWTRYSKELQNEAAKLSKKGYTGTQMYQYAYAKGWTSPPYKYQLVESAARAWAEKNRMNPEFAVGQASLLYYMETSGGEHMISSTGIVGHMQISNSMAAKLNLRNPISIAESTYAALDLVVLNGAEDNMLKNFAKHNLGTPTFISATKVVRGKEANLTPAAKEIILTNLPKSLRASLKEASDREIVMAYNAHLKHRAEQYLASTN